MKPSARAMRGANASPHIASMNAVFIANSTKTMNSQCLQASRSIPGDSPKRLTHLHVNPPLNLHKSFVTRKTTARTLDAADSAADGDGEQH